MKSKFGNRDYLSNNVGIYNKSKKKNKYLWINEFNWIISKRRIIINK